MIRKSELIVSFSHTNYVIKNGGTEKFVTELSQVLQQNEYNHLCFYPFMKRKKVAGKSIVGFNFNDEFIGVIWVKDIPRVIKYYIQKHNATLNCFHIHHLKRHDVQGVLSAIQAFNAKVFIFVHDFRLACISEHFIDSKGNFCGDDRPNESKCNSCTFYAEGRVHQLMMDNFIESLSSRIEAVICPSLYVKSVITKVFPHIADKIIIRPHLVFFGEKKLEKVNEPRLAFLGRKRDQKGYDKWLDILEIISIRPYKLFYLGIDVEDDEKVENIYVSTTTQGKDAMKNAIADNQINCAFLWPQCPETYSYVYYELLMSGVFIVTNEESGNIADEITTRKNGHIFGTLEECAAWFDNFNQVVKDLTEYRSNAIVPKRHDTNPDISMMVCAEGTVEKNTILARKSLLPLSTMLYKIKYMKNKV